MNMPWDVDTMMEGSSFYKREPEREFIGGIEIVRRGKPPGEEVAEFACSGCRSILKAPKARGKWRSIGENEEGYAIPCPVCKHVCVVDSNKFH